MFEDFAAFTFWDWVVAGAGAYFFLKVIDRIDSIAKSLKKLADRNQLNDILLNVMEDHREVKFLLRSDIERRWRREDGEPVEAGRASPDEL
jgi:hypothetical protein